MSETTCVLCRVYRPDAEPRFADTVCPADAARIERDLLAIPGLWHRLAYGEGGVVLRRSDPGNTPFGGAAEIPARSMNPAVTGSREAPLPINVDAVDLTGEARATTAATGDARDQIGYLPVTSVLDAWTKHIRAALHPDFHLPACDVANLVDFLHRHLPDALQQLPETLPELAADLRSLGSAMRVILRDVEAPQHPLLGVRCEHCQKISTLVPWSTAEYVECQACGQLYSVAERLAMGKRQLEQVRKPRAVALPALSVSTT